MALRCRSCVGPPQSRSRHTEIRALRHSNDSPSPPSPPDMSGFLHLLDWLYPSACELCGSISERTICPGCLAKLPRLPRPICLHCGCSVDSGWPDPDSCPECRSQPRHFAFARHAFQQSDAVMKLIHALKYRHASHMAPALAPALKELWDKTPELKLRHDWALVPVPITQTHLLQRGYNQAEELAVFLSRLTGVPVINALARRDTGVASQTLLTAAERRANAYAAIRPAKAWQKDKRKLPPHIVIIDDVFTTGSTARACAKALSRLPGDRTIGVLTLMHADRKKRTHP